MNESIGPRRFIVVLAAYVVALQALLLPLSIAAGMPTGSGLCVSAASTGGGPSGSDQPCPCAAGCGLQCCAQGVTGSPPQIGIAVAVTHAIVLTRANYRAPAQKPAGQGPQVPRPPPTA